MTAGLRCDVCAEPIGEQHRHLLDRHERKLRCACPACCVLLGRESPADGRYRLVPERVLRLEGFDLPDPLWRSLGVPVELAFFVRAGDTGRSSAFLPGPAGITEAPLPPGRWQALVERNPILTGMEADVEALLVHRGRDGVGCWLVPVDLCYALAGAVRGGGHAPGRGEEARGRMIEFLRTLSGRARGVPASGVKAGVRARAGRTAKEESQWRARSDDTP